MDNLNVKLSRFPKRIIMGINDGYCNLRCPMCLVQGSMNKNRSILKGQMSYDKALKIFDEAKEHETVITPTNWSEPFLIKGFDKYLIAIKKRGIPVAINTNGILLTKELSFSLVKLKVDFVFFSIDAVKKKTYMKLRGLDKIDKVENSVFMLLKARGSKLRPRIGTAFMINKDNIQEEEYFISKWLKHVDAVRIAKIYNSFGAVNKIRTKHPRMPCGVMNTRMVISYNGDVPMCGVDAHGKTNMGNVFRDGIKGVWLGEKFKEVRRYHQMGQFDKLPFCKNCDVWTDCIKKERKEGDILIRESPLITYYNRIDRI